MCICTCRVQRNQVNLTYVLYQILTYYSIQYIFVLDEYQVHVWYVGTYISGMYLQGKFQKPGTVFNWYVS